jgi:hypothetical protein
MAAARNKWAFKPYTVPPIPSGSYDPALDAQLYAAQRGYGDTAADVGTQTLRAGDDYGLNVEDINRTAGRSATDLSTARKPSNEFRSPSGVPYKVLKGAGGPIYVDRNGRRLPGRPR